MIDAIIAFALLASAITANKLVLCAIPATFFVAIRMLAAGTVLMGYHRFSLTVNWQEFKADFFKLAIIAVLTTFIPSVLKAYALKGLISSKAALLGSLDPFVTALYMFIFFKERLTFNQVLGIVLGFSGALTIIYAQFCPEEAPALWMFSYPELAQLGAIIIARIGWIEAQKLLKMERYSPTELNGLTMLIGGIYALVSAYFSNQIVSVHWSWPIVIGLIYTIIIGNVVAYSLYAYLLKKHSSTYVALTSLFVPLFVHCYGPIVLGEPLSATFFCALGLMFLGVWCFQRD